MIDSHDKRDYTMRGGVAAVAVILCLVCLSFIPPLEVWGFSLRRANILSELITFDDLQRATELAEPELEEVNIDWVEVSEAVAELQQPLPDTTQQVTRHYVWQVGAPNEREHESAPLAQLEERPRPMVLIEDYDTTGISPMREFYRKVACGEMVRIAFLGDSFVEGDILTADLRERFQLEFGGKGVGFAPMASPLTGFRRTIKTQAKGWTSHNIMQWQKSSEALQRNFTVAGWVCQPEKGASTRWQGSDARACLTDFDVAKVWFLSPKTSCVEVTINDTLSRRWQVEGDGALRQIEVRCPEMQSLQFAVEEGIDGFVGYGAQFSADEGVVVDNYSVRSNNGRAIFWSSPSLNAQLQGFNPYDLVILQYGLNIMQSGVHTYAKYSEQIEQLVAYVRQCFPGAAVLVLGVSERWVKDEKGFAPMDALPSMIKWQRAAAQASGAAFWSTSDAMQALGGMDVFVQNGWAGKDYTHINYGGGRQVAWALYEALYHEIYATWRQEQEQRVVRCDEGAVLREETRDLMPSLRKVEANRVLN